MKNRVFCVLGMHRSGTSCLTGTLKSAGMVLGDVSVVNPFNAKGDCEDTRIVRLHKDLLHANGGSWYAPPRSVRWSHSFRSQRDSIIRSYDGIRCWGFKDPRTLFTLDGWFEAVPDLQPVGIYRHPLAVARSLERRNGMSIEQGLQLWAEYNRRLLAFSDRLPFPILCFDLDACDFEQQLRDAVSGLGLEAEGNEFGFFDPALRHENEEQDQPLPANVAKLYAALQARTAECRVAV